MKSSVLLIVSLLSLTAVAQGPDPSEVRVSSGPYRPRPKYLLTVDTKLVEVGVVVRDPKGHPVTGLSKEDFEITDEGKKRPVAAFSVETIAPATTATPAEGPTTNAPAAATKLTQRYLALLFDDTSMGARELPQAQLAAKHFVTDGIKQGDHLALFTTSGTQNLPFTTDSAKFLDAISKLRLNSRMPSGGGCPQMSPYEAYVIANRIDVGVFNTKLREAASCANLPPPGDVMDFDGGRSRGSGRQSSAGLPKQILDGVKAQASSTWSQVRQISQNTMGAIADVVDYMGQMPEQRIILLASAGFLAGTLEQEFDQITRHAIHAGVVVNTLDAKGLYADESMQRTVGADPRSLTRMQAMGTIGNDAANDAAASLAYNTGGLFFHNNNDLDLGFRELGVRPDVRYLLAFAPDENADGKYHKLKVRLLRAKGGVQARLGYVDDPPEAAPPPERRIDTEAIGTDTLQEAAGGVTAVQGRMETGDLAVRAVFHLDIQKMRFDQQAGVRQQKVSLIAVVTDADGNFVTGKEGTVQFALKEPTYAQMSANGMNASLMLPVRAGKYNLRGVIQEGVDKVSASTQVIEIH